jgi:hypothetical protein
MKKLILLSVFSLMTWMSLDAQVYAVAASKAEYATQKSTGIITFRFGSDVLPETVLTAGENFTEYFTTSFDAATYVGTFTMKENVELNRLMLGRLLIGCGVEVIEFDGVQLPVYQFSNEQLK